MTSLTQSNIEAIMALRAIQDRVILEPVFGLDLSSCGIYLGEGPMTHAVVVAFAGVRIGRGCHD